MLDIRDSNSMIDDVWSVAMRRTKIPASWTDFFDQQGPAPIEFNNARAYHRFYLRTKAVVVVGAQHLAGYTKDVSRLGMGVYVPIQLFPRQRIRVWVPEGRDYQMTVTRCLRIGPDCYECGANFARTPGAKKPEGVLSKSASRSLRS